MTGCTPASPCSASGCAALLLPPPGIPQPTWDWAFAKAPVPSDLVLAYLDELGESLPPLDRAILAGALVRPPGPLREALPIGLPEGSEGRLMRITTTWCDGNRYPSVVLARARRRALHVLSSLRQRDTVSGCDPAVPQGTSAVPVDHRTCCTGSTCRSGGSSSLIQCTDGVTDPGGGFKGEGGTCGDQPDPVSAPPTAGALGGAGAARKRAAKQRREYQSAVARLPPDASPARRLYAWWKDAYHRVYGTPYVPAGRGGIEARRLGFLVNDGMDPDEVRRRLWRGLHSKDPWLVQGAHALPMVLCRLSSPELRGVGASGSSTAAASAIATAAARLAQDDQPTQPHDQEDPFA